MRITSDLHTHTLASTHAYSSLAEMVYGAKRRGLEMIAVTDHGTGLPDAPHLWHFVNTRVWPRKMDGIILIPGVEANVMDFDGNIDMPENVLDRLGWVIASLHSPCIPNGSREDYTRTYLGLAKNPRVDVIGHCGTEDFAFDYEKGVKAFKEYEKIVEINETSFRVRKGAARNCREIALLCKKHGVPIVVSSDAHIASDVGRFPRVLEMLEEIAFPEKMVVNTSTARVLEHIRQKKDFDLFAATGRTGTWEHYRHTNGTEPEPK